MNYLVEHYKRFGKIPLAMYKENVYPVVIGETAKTSFKLPPKKALDYLKNKGKNIITADKWNSIEAGAYAKAFTVAKVMSADVVQEVFDYVLKAKEEGWTLKTFQKNVEDGGLIKRMQEAGWTGKDASRLKVIYDTNMKIASAKGKYDGMKLISDIKPYWVYMQVERNTKRHDHSKFHGKKFRHDDPIWAYIFPPSDFECACYVTATADPAGVENGNQYIDDVKDSKDYNFKLLKQWEPDTSKYADKIKAQLEKILAGKKRVEEKKVFADKNAALPDCEWYGVQYADESGVKKCIAKVSGQKTWKDHNRPDIKDLADKYKLAAPDRLKAGETEADAYDVLTKALGVPKDGQRIVKTPIEEVVLEYGSLKHIVEKRAQAREKYANYIITTLTEPFEIYSTEYDDGTNRNLYVGIYNDKINILSVVRINKDGSLLWNVIKMKDKDINNNRIGDLLYGISIKE